MKIRGSLIFSSVLLLIFAAVVARSLTFGYWESSLFPLLIGGSCFVLLAIELCLELSAKDRTASAEQPDIQTGGSSFTNVMAWVSAFVIGIYLLGFLIAIVIFVFSYLKLRGRGWWVSAATSVTTVVVLYCIFKFGLALDLYGGLISQLIMGNESY